jgi:hypothetical protein
MDLHLQINSSDYLQMEDQLTIEEIEIILDFPISDSGKNELNHVQDSKFIGVRRPADASNDHYIFIDSFFGSGSAASTEQSVNLCVSDLQKPKGCPGNNAQFQNLMTGAKKNLLIGNLF